MCKGQNTLLLGYIYVWITAAGKIMLLQLLYQPQCKGQTDNQIHGPEAQLTFYPKNFYSSLYNMW